MRAPTPDLPWEPVTLEELSGQLLRADVSGRFGAFLPALAREAVRSGGDALVLRDAGRPVAIYLVDAVEGTASLFTRSTEIADRVVRGSAAPGVYAEVDLDLPRAVFDILARPLPAAELPPLVHPVRLLGGSAEPQVAGLLREVYGRSPDRWLRVAAEEGERAFGLERDGRLVGVAWVQLVAGEARLHSLTVRPEARRSGVGRDLLLARLRWAERSGATGAFSEVARTNAASQALSAAAGLRRSGVVYLYLRPGPPRGTGPARADRATNGSPRRTDTPSP